MRRLPQCSGAMMRRPTWWASFGRRKGGRVGCRPLGPAGFTYDDFPSIADGNRPRQHYWLERRGTHGRIDWSPTIAERSAMAGGNVRTKGETVASKGALMERPKVRPMTFDEAIRSLTRVKRFMATVYAMNSLLLQKKVYGRLDFERLFIEWSQKEQRRKRRPAIARRSTSQL